MNKEEIIKKGLRPHYGISVEDADCMFDVLRNMPEKGRLLEMSTGWGTSAKFFALLKPKWTIYTIDVYGLIERKIIKCQGNRKFNLDDIRKMIYDWKKTKIENIIPIIADSQSISWELTIDALFIDSDHSYESVKADFEKFYPFVKENGIIMFHDYHVIKEGFGVYQFINELKENYNIQTKGNIAIIYK
jgi:predicted O-methyltransferase YrrM